MGTSRKFTAGHSVLFLKALEEVKGFWKFYRPGEETSERLLSSKPFALAVGWLYL